MNRGEPRSRGVGRGGMGRGFGRGTYRVTSPEGSVHDVAVNRPKSRRRDLEGLFVTGKLYVRNVPCNNQDEIRIMFENFGELTNFFVFASRYETEDGQPLSDALVQYKTFREAEDALRNLHNCEPYFLDIEFAITDQEKAEGYTSGEDDSVIDGFPLGMGRGFFANRRDGYPSSPPHHPVERGRCHFCGHCGEEKCGDCHTIWYCSTQCQTRDWPQHQKFCRPLPRLIHVGPQGDGLLPTPPVNFEGDTTSVEGFESVLQAFQDTASIHSGPKFEQPGSLRPPRGRGFLESGRGGRGTFEAGARGQGSVEAGRGHGAFDSSRGRVRGFSEGGQGQGSFEGGQGRSSFEGGRGRGSFEGGRGRGSFEGGRGRGSFEGGRGRGSFEGGRGRGSSEGSRGRGNYESRGGQGNCKNGGQRNYETEGERGNYVAAPNGKPELLGDASAFPTGSEDHMPYQRGHIGGGASQGGTKGGKSFQGESGGFPQNGLTLTKPSHNKTTVEPVHIPSAMKSPPPISPLLPKDPTASQGLKKAPEPVVTSLDELKVVESTISGPIQELPPAILNARTQQAVVVTHMVNPGLLFVRQAGPESVYKTIVKDLAKTSAQSLQPGTIVAGFIIGIRLPNGSLYRGYVKEVKESQVEVYLLDTGVIVHIPDGSCFPLRHTLLSVPAQAVPCVLANVAPVERTWKPEDMTTAKQILALDDMASVPLFASVIGMMDRGQPVVTLVDEEFTDIGKFLTEVKVAQLISCDYKPFAPIAWMKEGTLKVKVPPSQLMVSAEEGCIPSMEDACVSGSLAYHIPMGTKTQGGCLHVEGEDMYMLVIPVEEALQEKLHQLVGNGFSENVNSFEEIPLSKVPLGSIVAAPYEGAWYRAYVIEKGSSACKVFFIDFGNQGSAETFRKIPASFRDFPGLAMKASIYSKVSLTDRDKAIFADMQAMKISQVNVEVVEKRDDRMRVKVLDGDHIPKNNLSLILSPWYKKFHSQTPSSPNLPEAQQESIVTSLLPSERQVPLADHLQWPQLIVGRRYQVICPFMLSLEKIFAQFLDQKELLGRLATALESYGKTEHGKWAGQAYAPLQGEVVAAIFPADQVWYRAKVLNIPGNGTIRVEFIDYGNEEVIPASNACPLPKDLAKDYPVLAVTVCLEGGNTLNLTEDANPVIFSMSVNPVTMVVKDALSQPAVVDFELEDGRTLTQLLKGEPAPTPPPPNPIQLTKNPINNEASGPTYDLESFPVGSLPIGEKVNLIPISVDTPNNFYCWLDDKNGLDDFRAFTDKMKSHCEKTVALQPSPYHPQQCEVFLAFSIQYGEWYRAACLEITTEQMIVLYVDFGSMETISLNDSQCLPLTPELAQQPAQAHFCCLPVVSLGEPKFPLEATTIMLNVLPLNISFEAIAISHDSSIQQYTIMHKPSIQALVEKGLARSSE